MSIMSNTPPGAVVSNDCVMDAKRRYRLLWHTLKDCKKQHDSLSEETESAMHDELCAIEEAEQFTKEELRALRKPKPR